jgi:dTDP-4-amino-4,6-dideoxygalactose transaminase
MEMQDSDSNYLNAPLASYLAHKDEIDSGIDAVLSGGSYILGKEVSEFEQEFANYIGVRFGVGVGSGTDALQLALRACSIGQNDEVVTVSHTAVATVAAIELCGARPAFVDIDPMTYTMDPENIESVITPKTKAILPVHIYGHPANMRAICAIANEYGLKVIEDCAQSHGAIYSGHKTGTWGDIAAFSFYPTKNLGAFGDGGIVITSNSELAENAKLLREYGWSKRGARVSQITGLNSRLDEIHAAVLRVKLRYLDEENNRRREFVRLYNNSLSNLDLKLPEASKEINHVYHQYVIRISDRDGLKKFLEQNNIITSIHYAVPVHLQPAYLHRYCASLPVTEKICKEIISLPMHPYLNNEQILQICEYITGWVQNI